MKEIKEYTVNIGLKHVHEGGVAKTRAPRAHVPRLGNSGFLKSAENNLQIALEMVKRARTEIGPQKVETAWIAEGDIFDALQDLRKFLNEVGR